MDDTVSQHTGGTLPRVEQLYSRPRAPGDSTSATILSDHPVRPPRRPFRAQRAVLGRESYGALNIGLLQPISGSDSSGEMCRIPGPSPLSRSRISSAAAERDFTPSF